MYLGIHIHIHVTAIKENVAMNLREKGGLQERGWREKGEDEK